MDLWGKKKQKKTTLHKQKTEISLVNKEVVGKKKNIVCVIQCTQSQSMARRTSCQVIFAYKLKVLVIQNFLQH